MLTVVRGTDCHTHITAASAFLRNQGYVLDETYCWVCPEGHQPTEAGLQAVRFLIASSRIYGPIRREHADG